MVAQKRTAPAPLVSPQQEKRKPWVKKTPVEIVLDQATKLREQIEAMPATERNYLRLERLRLQTADSLADNAVREANHAAEELQLANKLVEQHITQGDKQQ